jgi:hypothetical protein
MVCQGAGRVRTGFLPHPHRYDPHQEGKAEQENVFVESVAHEDAEGSAQHPG